MEERERIKRMEEKEDLIDEIKATIGREPQGLRQILGLLSHPDVLETALIFLKGLDRKHACLIYPSPWNCARESEAKYETVKWGWGVVGYNDAEVHDSWCVPCQHRRDAGTLDDD